MRNTTPELPGEEWRSVVEFEKNGPLEISNLGRIRHADSKEIIPQGFTRSCHQGTMYHRAAISCLRVSTGKPTQLSIGRGVLIAFLGQDKDPKRDQTGHVEDNQGDNRLSSLSWVTREENQATARRLRGNFAKPLRGKRATTDEKIAAASLARRISLNKACKLTGYSVDSLRRWRRQFPEVDITTVAA